MQGGLNSVSARSTLGRFEKKTNQRVQLYKGTRVSDSQSSDGLSATQNGQGSLRTEGSATCWIRTHIAQIIRFNLTTKPVIATDSYKSHKLETKFFPKRAGFTVFGFPFSKRILRSDKIYQILETKTSTRTIALDTDWS